MDNIPTQVLTLVLVVQFGIPKRNELSSLSSFGRMVRDPNISRASPVGPRDHRRASLGLNRERNSSLDRVQLSSGRRDQLPRQIDTHRVSPGALNSANIFPHLPAPCGKETY